MVKHSLWNDVKLTYYDLFALDSGWSLFPCVMRYADVVAVGDPVISAFDLMLRHQNVSMTEVCK